jgi:hypothetical protein
MQTWRSKGVGRWQWGRTLDIDVSRVLSGAQGKIQLHPNGRRMGDGNGTLPALEVGALA